MQPGSSIAHYSVMSRIGAGGMGEVYRAHDTKLGRDVAVKGLPAALFRGPGGIRKNSTGATMTPDLVAVDRDRFLFNVAEDDGREPAVRIVVNWERMLAAAR